MDLSNDNADDLGELIERTVAKDGQHLADYVIVAALHVEGEDEAEVMTLGGFRGTDPQSPEAAVLAVGMLTQGMLMPLGALQRFVIGDEG